MKVLDGIHECGVGRIINRSSRYKLADLLPLFKRWDKQAIIEAASHAWERYVNPACGICHDCKRGSRALYCLRNPVYLAYRNGLARLLKAIHRYGSIARWWAAERQATFARTKGSVCETSWLIFVYLLDRQLIDVTCDELVHAAFSDIFRTDLTRPWRHRHPEEYERVVHGLELANYAPANRQDAITCFALMILLRHGLAGIEELHRKLTPAEIERAVAENCLQTMHLKLDVYLPCPLTSDVRVGHLLLDALRLALWKRGSSSALANQPHWKRMNMSPLKATATRAIEKALTAPLWDQRPFLETRPETDTRSFSPFEVRRAVEAKGHALSLLPKELQRAILAGTLYRYRDQHLSLETIRRNVDASVRFLCFAQQRGDLADYARWSAKRCIKIAEAWIKEGMYTSDATIVGLLSSVFVFLKTLDFLELPHPTGYQGLSSLIKSPPKRVRYQLPSEAVMDRIFQNGVRALNYDPLSRLALTIQYYCETRVLETCQLHLYCVLEHDDGRIELLIPQGKTKTERPFPIVDVGMAPLLEYMDQVIAIQCLPDGTPRMLARSNVRYLDSDPDTALEWYYLFDRSYVGETNRKARTVLSPGRVREALREALTMAATVNSAGLFQSSTYEPHCHHTRRKGQYCDFLPSHSGVMICPICGKSLTGECGKRCHSILKADFTCDRVAEHGEVFCPKCHAPLAQFIKLTPHTFRHNSVTRAHRAGVPLAQNMALHGHETVPMHIRYLHPTGEDARDAVYSIMSAIQQREVILNIAGSAGQVIEQGIPQTISLAQYMALTLRRGLRRKTVGLWGAFVTQTLAEEGTDSPFRAGADIVLTHDTYDHAVAQYRYEALGLAISEVTWERLNVTGSFKAHVPPYLNQREIDQLVQLHLPVVSEYAATARGRKLIEIEIERQRAFVRRLEDLLRPWWESRGSPDELILALTPPGIDRFQQPDNEAG